MTEAEVLEILIRFKEYLKVGNMWEDGIRTIGMLIVKALAWFVDEVSGNFTQILGVLNFRNNDIVDELLTTFAPIQKLLLGLAILAIGLVLYFGKNAEIRNIPMNTFLIVCTLTMLPSLMTDAVRLTEAVGKELTAKSSGLGFQVVKSNLTDVYQLGGSGWTTESVEVPNHVTDFSFFDINERIEDAKKVDPDGVLDYQATNKISGEGYEVKKLKQSDGLLDAVIKSMVTPSYYRWKLNWIPVFLTLIALTFATGLFVVRAGRLGIEYVFNYLWASITAFFHIRDLRKFKQAVMEIFTGLVLLGSMFVLFYLYIAYNAYLANGSYHFLIKALLYVGGAWLLFDGPAIIQKQLGMDAGLSTAGGVLAGFGAGKLSNVAHDTVDKAASGGSGIAGLLAGLRSGGSKETGDDSSDDQSDKDGGINSSMDEGSNDDTNEEESSDGLNQNMSDAAGDDQNETGGDAETGLNEQLDGNEKQEESDSSSEDSGTSGINDQLDGSEEKQAESDHGGQGINESMSDDQGGNSSDDGTSKQINEAMDNMLDDKSKEASKEPEKPVKPKNPLFAYAKEQAMTPKSMKNKSIPGNAMESHDKGKALGRDLVDYSKQRKEYKQAKKDYKEYEKNKKGD